MGETFPWFFKLAKSILALPYSTAEVERLFSTVKQVKTDKRINIHDQTLESILMIKLYFRMGKELNEKLGDNIIKKYNKANETNNERSRLKRMKKDITNTGRKEIGSESVVKTEKPTHYDEDPDSDIEIYSKRTKRTLIFEEDEDFEDEILEDDENENLDQRESDEKTD